MSAIAGLYQWNGEQIAPEQGERMMNALSKYPADDIGLWMNQNAFLGCHTQWVTPESMLEHLPIYDARKRLAITADAILDNRGELFERIGVNREDRPHIGDGELILLAYEKWGEDAPKHLMGDFAFIIWDEANHRLFGARDFSGSRPLYFHTSDHLFAFCTTIHPLLQLPLVKVKPNDQWIAEFLAIHITTEAVNPYATVYEAIQQLPPAHCVTVTNGSVKFAQYCTLAVESKLKLKSNEEYEEAFRDVFQNAVHSRLRTHRRVGSNLSGGLDSGSVASFAARKLQESGKALHTFSYVPVEDFDGRPKRGRFADERPFIESTVDYVGNMKDHYFSFPDRNPFSDIDDWLELYEMPYKFFENSFWIKGIYEEARKRDIGVLLSGQRGNWSVSWGPAIDYYSLLMRRMQWIRLYQEVNLYCRNLSTGRKRLYHKIAKKAFPIIKHFEQTNDEQIPYLISPSFAQRTNVVEKVHAEGFNHTDYSYQSAYKVRDHQYLNPNVWNLTGTVNAKLSLMNSVSGCDPTNDLRLIRFCLSVPDDQFVQNGYDRALIRRATNNLLPDKVRLNMKTRGVQGADGVHRMGPYWREFINEIRQLLQDPIAQEYLNITELNAALEKYGDQPREEYIFEFQFRLLMRALIFYRFMKKFY